MNKLPLTRNTDIVVQELGKELLIYNLKTHRCFNLNETSAIVYKSCDGVSSFAELKSKHKLTDDLIFLALDQLKEEGLVENDNNRVSPFNGVSRREAIRKAGLASMVAIPLITSLIAPSAVSAQSGTVGLGADCTAAACSPGLVCTNQFGANVCRATAGATCTFSRPDLCTSGCCTASANGPVCCSN